MNNPSPLKNKVFKWDEEEDCHTRPPTEPPYHVGKEILSDSWSAFQSNDVRGAVEWLKEQLKHVHKYEPKKLLIYWKLIDRAFHDVTQQQKEGGVE